MYFHYNFWHWLLIICMVFMLFGCDRTERQREMTQLDGEAIALNNRAVGLMGALSTVRPCSSSTS